MGEGISEDPFDSSIDASWLGAAPTAEDAFGNPIAVSDTGNGSGAAAAEPEPEQEAPEAGAAEAGA
jgi:hypothetical protein